jgi:hypothetical protein
MSPLKREGNVSKAWSHFNLRAGEGELVDRKLGRQLYTKEYLFTLEKVVPCQLDKPRRQGRAN